MKKTVELNGQLLMPLQEGSRTIIFSGGDIIRTSLVVEIRECSPERVHFETMNSVYRVNLAPQPIGAAQPIPLAA